MGKIVAVSMFKNEGGIAYHTLDHLASEGVDAIIVADNLSTDNTRADLERAQRCLPCPVVIVDDREFAYHQDKKMTALAARAHADFGADWIIPFDADEIWYAERVSLKDKLARLPRHIRLLQVDVFNHRATAKDGPGSNPFQAMPYRQPQAEWYSKCAFRYSDNFSLVMGNHTLVGKTAADRLPRAHRGVLRLRHFHRWSFEEHARRVLEDVDAIEATRSDKSLATHWRKSREIYLAGGREALLKEWQEKHYSFNPDRELVLDPAPFKKHASAKSLTRYDILNMLIERYGYHSYLEIGVDQNVNFSRVRIDRKDSVDPNGKAVFNMTSDAFFEKKRGPYDIVFIDGLHTADQVRRDIDNALRCLSVGGAIVVHDCLPAEERQQRPSPPGVNEPWTGDVWKAWATLRSDRDDLSMDVVDTDWGCGVIRRGSQRRIDLPEKLDWSAFFQQRDELLNVITPTVFAGRLQRRD